MTHVDLDVLTGWRESVKGELEEVRERMRPLEEELRRKQEELAAIEQLISLRSTAAPSSSRSRENQPAATDGPSFLDAAHDVLAKHGKPVHYLELHRLVAESGVHVPGRRPAANLLAHMTRDSRFVWVSRGQYGLAERDEGVAKPKKRKKRRATR
jgi:hypothetical protein